MTLQKAPTFTTQTHALMLTPLLQQHTDYATAAQGTQADTNDTDIDDLYTALNAIGNDASITNMTQLKAALAALTR